MYEPTLHRPKTMETHVTKQPSQRFPTASDVSESDLAQEKMGRNKLQGNDQSQVRNQRHAVPGVKQETDGIIESLEKLDDDVRAERDLGKGNRHSPDNAKHGQKD